MIAHSRPHHTGTSPIRKTVSPPRGRIQELNQLAMHGRKRFLCPACDSRYILQSRRRIKTLPYQPQNPSPPQNPAPSRHSHLTCGSNCTYTGCGFVTRPALARATPLVNQPPVPLAKGSGDKGPTKMRPHETTIQELSPHTGCSPPAALATLAAAIYQWPGVPC